MVTECYRAVVGILVRYQDVPVKASHFFDRKDAYASERLRWNRQHLALRNIGSQTAAGCALQPVECDFSGFDITFERASCYVRFLVRFD